MVVRGNPGWILRSRIGHRKRESQHVICPDAEVYPREVGTGRVVYLALGHDMRAWGEPPFRALVRQALAWASGRES